MATITYTINATTSQISAPSGAPVTIPGSEGQDVTFFVTTDEQTAVYVAPDQPPAEPGDAEASSLAPLAGVMDATSVNILGASITVGGFESGGNLRPAILHNFSAMGFTGTLRFYGQSGSQVDDALNTQLPAAQADIAAQPPGTQDTNLFILHTGGNNVSGQRPYPGGEATFSQDYNDLIDDASVNGLVVPLPLTKRLYNTAPIVTDGDTASEANGSLPYNENVIVPAIVAKAQDWIVDSAPFVNPYELADQYPELLSSDGIHGYSKAFADYVLCQVAARGLGIAKGTSRAGKSVVIDYKLGDPNDSRILAAGNEFHTYTAASGLGLNHPHRYGALFTDGTLDPHIIIHHDRSGGLRNGSNTGTTEAYSRLADSRFHTEALVSTGFYLQGADEPYTAIYDGLTPGDTVTVSVAAVRNAGGTSRVGDYTLTGTGLAGETIQISGANDAASNQGTFAPVVVPDDGRLRLSVSVAAGSTYAYLTGVVLDFS